ncbi:MAG: hypothetical protein WBQ54_16180, partial [Pseudolabrys sp.]
MTGATALFMPRVGTRAFGKRFRQRVTAERGIRGILKDAAPSLRKAPAFPFDWRPLKPEPTRSLCSPFPGRNKNLSRQNIDIERTGGQTVQKHRTSASACACRKFFTASLAGSG